MTVSLLSVGYKSGCSHDIGAASSSLPQLVLTPIASDNFNRANSPLAGSHNWLATSNGTMNISANEAIGTAATTLGNYRTGETYNNNQFSQCTVGSVALVSGGYIGLSVRNQDNQNNYTGIYFNNAGTFELILYRKVAGSFVQIIANTLSGALAQGALLQLVAEGSQITFTAPGQTVPIGVSATDTTYTSGTAGIESFGANSLANWVAGNAATTALSAPRATDPFTRANGGVSSGQANWQIMTYSPSVGATVDNTIVSNQIVDTTVTVHSGDTRTDSFNSDHWSAIQEGTTAMTSSGFTGATARCQNGGRAGYLGVFFQNNSYAIYRLDQGATLGTDTSHLIAGVTTPGNDPAGTPYAIVTKGSRISLRVNGSEILAVTDTNYTGGEPGIMNFATSSSVNWSGGNT